MRINRPSPRSSLRRRRKKPKLTTIIKWFAISVVCVQSCVIFLSSRNSAQDEPNASTAHTVLKSSSNEGLKGVEGAISSINRRTTSMSISSNSSMDNNNSVITTRMRTLENTHQHHLQSQCPRNLDETQMATTLVTQTTLDRLQLLQETCLRWTSPIVSTVYITPTENKNSWKQIVEKYEKMCSHMVLIPYVALNDEERDNAYPINALRNIGLDAVKTSHILLIDADFIPSVDLDKGVKKAIDMVKEKGTARFGIGPSMSSYSKPHSNSDNGNDNDNASGTSKGSADPSSENSISSRITAAMHHLTTVPHRNIDRHHHALVVPAYERKFDKSFSCGNLQDCLQFTLEDAEFIPRSMESLSKCVNRYATEKAGGEAKNENAGSSVTRVDAKDGSTHSKCIVFHSDYFPKGHGNTQSDAWLKGMDKNTIRSIPCIDDGYEPYVVIPWCPTKYVNHQTDYDTDTNPRQNMVRTPINVQSKTNMQVAEDKWRPLSPYYDERFYGYGKNKIQQVLHLRARGYEFAVIPASGFLTHHPHPVSNTRKVWKNSKTIDKEGGMQTKMMDLFKQYKTELKKEYEGKVLMWTKFCPKKVAQPKISHSSPYLAFSSLALIALFVLRFAKNKRKDVDSLQRNM